jgi:hypothetical protein
MNDCLILFQVNNKSYFPFKRFLSLIYHKLNMF